MLTTKSELLRSGYTMPHKVCTARFQHWVQSIGNTASVGVTIEQQSWPVTCKGSSHTALTSTYAISAGI